MGSDERKPCFIKEFGECTRTNCDECIRGTYHIRKASYDKGYADCRQAVLNLPRRTLKNYFGEVVGDVVYVDDIEALSTVTPKQKMGRWIESNDIKFYKCSECGCYWERCVVENCNMEYCPNCGAKMVEPQESEDKESE